jgi:hypothetical protein
MESPLKCTIKKFENGWYCLNNIEFIVFSCARVQRDICAVGYVGGIFLVAALSN